MGLIKAAKDAVSTMLADQWREYFYCDSLSNEIMVAKGTKRVTNGRNSNTKGVDNIISNGSIIAVNEGQCMIIVDQGGIVEFSADAGEFVYDNSTEPSLFYGNLGESLLDSFKRVGQRFTFGGNTAKDQRVYYFNTKEITNNLYGTATPIDFHLVSPRTGFELETTVRCNGQYSFKIVDPLMFYKNVCGNVEETFSKTNEGAKTLSLMKSELLTKLPMALAPIAAQGILPYQLQMHIDEIIDYLKKGLSEQWTETRGIEVVSMTIAATVPAEDRDKINEWNNRVMLTDPNMQAARKTEAMANFMENSKIGGDGSGGGASGVDAAMGMMAMNMMNGMMGGGSMMGGNNMMNGGNMANGGMAQGMHPQNQAPAHMQPAGAAVLGWTCSCGKTDNRGRFCEECGAKKPGDAGWTCSCGTVNQGKFCQNCGSKRPAGAPLYKCDKCGWEPEDPTKPPKFCPECGDVFDENDIQ